MRKVNLFSYWNHVYVIFSTILNSKILLDKKILMHSKPFTKINNCHFVTDRFRFANSSDQTIIQIIRKNKPILMFLIKPRNCFTGKYLKSFQHLR